MLFQFNSAVQAAIEAGKYVQVFTSAGVPIGLARDASTGKFVAQAVGMMAQNTPISPLFSPAQMVIGAAQMYQTHQGFTAVQVGLQTIQSSLRHIAGNNRLYWRRNDCCKCIISR